MPPQPQLRTNLTHIHSVYILEVIQQPQRARACGFGDKVSSVSRFVSPKLNRY